MAGYANRAKKQVPTSYFTYDVVSKMDDATFNDVIFQLQSQGSDGQKYAASLLGMRERSRQAEIDDVNRRNYENANDPVRQMGMIGGSSMVGALGRDAVTNGIPALWESLGSGGGSAGSLVGEGTTGTAGAYDLVGAGVPETLFGSSGSGAAATGGETAAAGGMGESLAAAGPYAAAIAAIIAGARGLNEGYQTYQQGHGRQQQGIVEMLNPVNTGARAIFPQLGKIPGIGVVDDALALANPISMPFKAAELAGINFWSGKDQNQLERDAIREALQENKLLDENYNLTLDDGTKFDMGRDGGEPYYNVGFGTSGYVDKNTEENPNAVSQYIDANFGQDVGALDPLSNLLLGGNFGQDRASDLTGYMTNAVNSGGSDHNANILGLYNQAGYDRNTAAEGVWKLFNDGLMTPEQRNAQLASIDRIFNWENPNVGKGGELEFGAGYIPGT